MKIIAALNSWWLVSALCCFTFFETFSYAANVEKTLGNLCLEGSWNKVQKRLESIDDPKTIKKQDFESCINESLCHGHIKIFNYLVGLTNNGAKYATAKCIFKAIKRGNVNTLKFALENGLDISQTRNNESVLHKAARTEDAGPALLALFFSQYEKEIRFSGKALFNLELRSNKTGGTALGEAIKQKSYESAEILIKHGASLLDGLYIAQAQNRIPEIVEPTGNEEEKALVRNWLKANRTHAVSNFMENKNITNLNKFAAYQFVRFHSSSRAVEKLKKIWMEYEHDVLDRLITEANIVDLKKPTEEKNQSDAEKKANDDRVLCLDLCDQSDAKEHTVIGDCGHKICTECAKFHVNYALASPVGELICPKTGCKAPISWETIADLGVSKDEILSRQVMDKETRLSKQSGFSHCQRPDCPGGSLWAKKFDQEKEEHFSCQICGHLQCKRCGKPHPKVDCQDICVKQNESFIKTQIKKEKIKKCPKCDVNIEKNDGCDHMTCQECDYEFYWTTLKKYKG